MYFGARAAFVDLFTGVPSPDAHVTGSIALFIGTAVTLALLALATYLAFVYPRSPRHSALVGSAISLTFAVSVSAVYFLAVPIHGCGLRADTIVQEKIDAAISELSKCLNLRRLTTRGRVEALHVRAWAHYRLGQYSQATDDIEAAFKLHAPNDAKVLAQYAMYLRRASRLDESFKALDDARRLDVDGTTAARIEYQKGLALAASGRHEEAVVAFSEVLKSNPSALWTYWNRGLAYEKLGREASARTDFHKFEQLLTGHRLDARGLKSLEAVRAKLQHPPPR